MVIVVLPFANLGGDPEQEYFADGVTESLTTDLSHMIGLVVIGRSTAFRYKGKAVDLKQIGRDLNGREVQITVPDYLADVRVFGSDGRPSAVKAALTPRRALAQRAVCMPSSGT